MGIVQLKSQLMPGEHERSQSRATQQV